MYAGHPEFHRFRALRSLPFFLEHSLVYKGYSWSNSPRDYFKYSTLLKAPQDDYMEVENEQYPEGGADEQQSVPEQTTQSVADQDTTHGEQWQWQAENEWGRPPYHQEHAGDAGIVNSDLATIACKLKQADKQYLKLQKIFKFAPSAT